MHTVVAELDDVEVAFRAEGQVVGVGGGARPREGAEHRERRQRAQPADRENGDAGFDPAQGLNTGGATQVRHLQVDEDGGEFVLVDGKL